MIIIISRLIYVGDKKMRERKEKKGGAVVTNKRKEREEKKKKKKTRLKLKVESRGKNILLLFFILRRLI